MNGLSVCREGRVQAMVQELDRVGLVVDLPTLRRSFPRAILGRPHLARLPGENRPDCQRARGLHALSRRWPARLRGQVAARSDRGDRVDPGGGRSRRAGAIRRTTCGPRCYACWSRAAWARSRRPALASRTGFRGGFATGPGNLGSSRLPAATFTSPTVPGAGSAPSQPPIRIWSGFARAGPESDFG